MEGIDWQESLKLPFMAAWVPHLADCSNRTYAMGNRLREWVSVAAAAAIGPVFVIVGYSTGVVFGAGAVALVLLCVFIVPVLTLAADRSKFLAWQLAIVSIVLAVVGDNLRLNTIHRSQVPSVAFGFWAGGTLLSSPLPIYFLLKPLRSRQRYIVAILILAIALALSLGLKRNTG